MVRLCVVCLLCWFACLGLSWHAEAEAAAISREGWRSYFRLKRLLRRKRLGRLRGLSKGFAIIALSNAAQGIASVGRSYPKRKSEAQGMLKRLLRWALSPDVSPYKRSPAKVRKFGAWGLYLSHLTIVMGEVGRLSGKRPAPALHRRIVRHLVRRSLAHPTRHIRSYGTSRHRWPADQTATLYGLWLYDHLYKTHMLRGPLKAWLHYMRRKGRGYGGLHVSNVSGARRAKIPRGCALSWSVMYLSRFAPREAKRLYRQYRRRYLVRRWGFAGFREWPPGVRGPTDNDSGPIVMGVGAAATAFGIGAARSMGDIRLMRTLQRTRRWGNWIVANLLSKKHRRLLRNLLTLSITLNTDTIPTLKPAPKR